VSNLLAGCGPSEERKRTLPVMEFPARNERHATQQKKKKQRGKLVDFKDLHARNNARRDYRINMIHINENASCEFCLSCNPVPEIV
jgi:hypothetical protein